jgi:ribosomal protein L37AE/L43A
MTQRMRHPKEIEEKEIFCKACQKPTLHRDVSKQDFLFVWSCSVCYEHNTPIKETESTTPK